MASVNPVVAYVADEVSVYAVLLYVPDAVAVFGFEPAAATTGPTTQVAIWLSLPATATGREAGQVQLAAFTDGSETLTGLRITSPAFSIVN